MKRSLDDDSRQEENLKVAKSDSFTPDYQKLYAEILVENVRQRKVIEEKDRNGKWVILLSSMMIFIHSNLSTTVRSSQDVIGNITNFTSLTVPAFLKFSGLTLAEPLSREEWRQFCNNITIIQNDDASERLGIHPLVRQLISTVLTTLSPDCQLYKMEYDRSVIDDEQIAEIPNISIKTNDCTSRSISSVVVPIKIKLKGNVYDAIRQSVGYLMSKLRDQLEISLDCTSKLFGYCIGTDGYSLCLGKIEIENYEYKVFVSDINVSPFWSSDVSE